MTKRYKTLQKKLQELEAKISLVFSVPAETTPHHHLNLNPERIQRRFAFLKNLLSAEIACRPSKPSHLRHIGKRITELEIAFRDHVCHVGDNDTNYNFDIPSSSVCSCDESSLEDDGETAAGSSDLTSPELGSSEDELLVQQNNSPRALVKVKIQRNGDSSSSDEKVEVQRQKNSPREKKLNIELSSSDHEVHQQNKSSTLVKSEVENEVSMEKKEGSILALRKYCGALIGGTILGMILMGVALAMVGDCGFSYSPPLPEGFHFYT